MQRLIAGIAATLSVAVLAAVLATYPEGPEGEPPPAESTSLPGPQVVGGSTASSVPCAVPMTWNVVRIDSRFGLDSADAIAAVAAAASAWEEALDRALFQHLDSDARAVDLPVRFYFDERQERGLGQRRAEEELAALDARLTQELTEIEAAVASLEESREDLRRRAEEFEGRLAAYNDTVLEWNQTGGAPQSVRERLSERRRSLEAESTVLQTERDELDDVLARIDAQREAYDVRVAERNRRVREVVEDFPDTAVESGLYREAVAREGGRIASVEREIRIYRFGNQEDLVRIAAHELGHALGLGHSDDPAALMSPEFVVDGVGSGSPLVVESDVEMFRSRCPSL